MWPGSTSIIKNTKPSYVVPFKNDVPPKDKFSKLIEWLLLPRDKRPNLIATYIPEVDQNGHKYGPDSKQVTDSIRDVDFAIYEFVEKLQYHGLYDKVNIVVVSDHGMTCSQIPKYIYYIEDLLSKAGFTESEQKQLLCGVNLWPLGGLSLCRKDDIDTVYNKIKSVEDPLVWRVYKRSQIPQRYHYSNNVRIPQILIETHAVEYLYLRLLPNLTFIFNSHI